MYARIENGIVAEIIDFDPSGKFHSSLLWVECDNSVGVGYSYLDDVFSPPIPETQTVESQRKASMMTGVEFDGVMCSACKQDQWGLASIKPVVESGTDIDFEFENGNVLTLTAANLPAFEATWVPFRLAHTKVNFQP